MSVRQLRLRPAGMFSNINEVIQQLHIAEKQGYRFVIDWQDSCYLDPGNAQDPWLYYFEECFPDIDVDREDLPPVPTGRGIVYARGNIITPRLADGVRDPLLLPKNRLIPHRIITRHIVLREGIQALIDRFYRTHMEAHHVIGVHLRGPGRLDGGATVFHTPFSNTRGVPFEPCFRSIDARLVGHPEARILACSESSYVIDEIRERYGERVFTYDATRTEHGEMHASRTEIEKRGFSPYKLGEDVLVEAHLLSKTDFFIHGNSNVANFVLCNNPYLGSEYIFCDIASEMKLWRVFWRSILDARLEDARKRFGRFHRRVRRKLTISRR